MYTSSSLRAAARVSRGTVVRSALLGRIGGGGAAAPAGCVVAASRGRSASSLAPAAASAAGGGMEQPKQQPQQENVVSGEKNDTHKGHHWCPITHSFGEGYATRADEEGFGGVYARGHDDDDDEKGHGHHPEYDTSQGCVVKEKEKGRHFKDEKHAA